MERHPTHMIEALLGVLVVHRDRRELRFERRRFRRPMHEAQVQRQIDRAYEDARRMLAAAPVD